MKPHPRIRKTIKWGGAAVTVLLVVVWIGSGWRSFGRVESTGRLEEIRRGGLFILVPPADLNMGGGGAWHLGPCGGVIDWQPSWNHTAGVLQIFIPLWIPTVVSAIVTALGWRLDTLARRRARLNLCPKCHYDRAGLAASAVCPECGMAEQR